MVGPAAPSKNDARALRGSVQPEHAHASRERRVASPERGRCFVDASTRFPGAAWCFDGATRRSAGAKTCCARAGRRLAGATRRRERVAPRTAEGGVRFGRSAVLLRRCPATMHWSRPTLRPERPCGRAERRVDVAKECCPCGPDSSPGEHQRRPCCRGRAPHERACTHCTEGSPPDGKVRGDVSQDRARRGRDGVPRAEDPGPGGRRAPARRRDRGSRRAPIRRESCDRSRCRSSCSSPLTTRPSSRQGRHEESLPSPGAGALAVPAGVDRRRRRDVRDSQNAIGLGVAWRLRCAVPRRGRYCLAARTARIVHEALHR
jgi:hypothetical protein